MTGSHLYGWVFAWNPYQEKWMATTRENFTALFSNIKHKDVFKSSDPKALQQLIMKGKGDPSRMRTLIK
jgi:hypothetical protein